MGARILSRILRGQSGFSSEQGYSLLDLLVSISMLSIISGFAVFNLRAVNDASDSTVDQIVGVMRDARSRAFSSTLAYTVDMSSSSRVRSRHSALCSSTTKTEDLTLSLQIPGGTTLSDTTWSVCFDSRGFATNSIQATATDSSGRTSSFEVVLGGAARKL